MWTVRFVNATRPRPDAGAGRITDSRRRSSASPGGAPCSAATRYRRSPSHKNSMPNLASQMRVALSSIARNTGSRSKGKLEMTRSTANAAVCCSRASASSSRASASSWVRVSSFFSSSARDSCPRLTRVIAFVLVERTLRPRVRLFACLGDKVPWIAPCWRS
jgi:hypothetical protein